MKLYEQGTSQLSKITVQSGSYSHEQEFTGNSLSGTLPNGTTYQMELSNSGGSDALYLTTSNLVDDLQIHRCWQQRGAGQQQQLWQRFRTYLQCNRFRQHSGWRGKH